MIFQSHDNVAHCKYDMLHPHGLEKVSNIKGFTLM